MNPLLDNRASTQSNLSSASSYARKMASAGGGMGMMPGMPLIPKGMVFSKPS